MGGGGVPRGGPPSHVAYYIALAGIFALLLLLCCYFFYFFVKKVKELSEQEMPSTTPSSSRAGRPAPAYPVQPEVREGASAMAKLCAGVPAGAGAGGAAVFPAARSPPALRALAAPPPAPSPAPPPAPPPRTKLLAPPAASLHVESVR